MEKQWHVHHWMNLLSLSQIVTLHVPETPLTKNMIGEREIALMRKGSCLVNASRGSVVNIRALTAALKSGHILGAALDVFPEEPASNNDPFISELQQFDNVILSPHVGGSTMEAQENIGTEVAEKLIKYSDTGRYNRSNQFCSDISAAEQECPAVSSYP